MAYRASRAVFSSVTSSLADGSDFVTKHSSVIKLMGSVIFGTMALTAYVSSLLVKRDLALLEERRQREVNEQRSRVEMLERVLVMSYNSDWAGLREKIKAMKSKEVGSGNGAGAGNGASAGPAPGPAQP
ncbi:hypothetical protein HXX76_004864 [Chlamydomonas incerta]|uniref:Uncharacterized protein n=1 Tax=Chlamydomonas incerta TaxID=51695 RepID=A0A835W4X5_CHLIN|nr:hypothetical protein HXX76_004864 [Chlamydomonas incerta]|eukprot:KAG2439510.1 hypothetical protein HXX76_004864 [Chlamydomonas incerta]